MADAVENKRAGRDKELRTKLKAALDRYESVFGVPLSSKILKEYMVEEEKRERLQFIRDRVGLLSAQDIKFLRGVLAENEGSPETELEVQDAEDEIVDDEGNEPVDAIDELDEITI